MWSPSRLLILFGLLAGSLLPAVAAPDPAAAQPTPDGAGPGCTVTGYLVPPGQEVSELSSQLAPSQVHQLEGVPLDRESAWVIPDGSQPVLVVDAATPVLSGGELSVVLGGQRLQLVTDRFEQSQYRYVSSESMPFLGPTVRSLGLVVDSGGCQLPIWLSVDRPLWSTQAGAGAVAVAALFGLLTVLVGRLRKGGWARRFGFAAPFGLVAGAGQAVVLLEAGVVSPFESFPWWPLVAGLALAAVAPLTRRRRSQAAPAAASPAGPGSAVRGDALSGPPATVDAATPGSGPEIPDRAGPEAAPHRRTRRVLAGVGNTAVAVVVAVVVLAGAALLDPQPAGAGPMVITPERARVLFTRTIEEVATGRDWHVTGEVFDDIHYFLIPESAIAGIEPARVVVGVPPEQHAYPAWFVASGQLAVSGGRTVHVLARFDRESAPKPWQLSTFIWLRDEPVGTPQLDAAGWLAPAPDPAALVADPAELPQRYIDWHSRSFDAARILADDLLAPRALVGDRRTLTEYRIGSIRRISEQASVSQEMEPIGTAPAVIPLTDGSALVTFTVKSYETSYNSPLAGRTRPCEVSFGWRWLDQPDPEYRQLSMYGTVQVVAWVPGRGDAGKTATAGGTVLLADPQPIQYLDQERSVQC